MASLEPRALLVLPALLVLSSCVSDPEGPRGSPELAGLDRGKLWAIHGDLEERVRLREIPGAVALVARRGKTAYLDAVGFRDLEAGDPMTPAAIFRICSMTKAITSVAAMMLVEEGRLSLEDPVAKFIPEFAGVKVLAARADGGAPDAAGATPAVVPAERPVTVRHLLTHTSGLSYPQSAREPAVSRLYIAAGVSDGLLETGWTLEENARRIAAVPLLFQPGTDWEYGLSTDVLGRVIEVASGKDLDRFFSERIFVPLGMSDTTFHLPEGKRDRLAAVYRPKAGGGLERLPDGPIPAGPAAYSTTYPLAAGNRYLSGGAGLVSTAADYARFLQALLGGGEAGGVRILRKDTVEAMIRPGTGDVAPRITSHGDAFGLGFGIVTEKGVGAGLGSPGTFSWAGFYDTYFWVDPRKELIGVLMCQMQPWGSPTLWADFRKRVYESILD